MISSLLGQPDFYLYASCILAIAFGLIFLGHEVLDLLRDKDRYLEERRKMNEGDPAESRRLQTPPRARRLRDHVRDCPYLRRGTGSRDRSDR